MLRCVLITCVTLTTCVALETSWSSKLGLPPGTDEDLAKDFYIHKDAIGQWIRSLGSEPTSVSSSRADPFNNCPLCFSLVNFILSLIRNDPNSAKDVMIQLCTSANMVSGEICQGIMERYVPSAIFIATERPHITATDACAILIQGGSCGKVNESLSDWEIYIEGEPPVYYPAPYPQGHPMAKILHLSDIRLDSKYAENSHANCDDPVCCRNPVPENTSSATLAGKFGDYECECSLGGMNSLLEDAAYRCKYLFGVVTGGFNPYIIWDSSKEVTLRNFDVVTDKLNELFPYTRIYPVVGNQDFHPINMVAPRSVWNANEGAFNISWMYDGIATRYERHLTPDAAASFRSRGFYTLLTPQGVRIIALNTCVCNSFNFWILYESADPEGQLQWFSDTLAAAEKAGEMVYVLGHIPPGHIRCWSTWSAQYNKIINRYAHLIKGQFYGHMERDEFEIFFEKSSTEIEPAPPPTSCAFVGPSVTPYDDVNPSYRVYKVDGAVSYGTWEIVDHDTYYFDVGLANEEGKTTVTKLYSAREAYGLKTLKPEELYDFVKRMVKDDALFQLFCKHLSRNSPTAPPCNDSTYRMTVLCGLVTTNYDDQSHCDGLKAMMDEQQRQFKSHRAEFVKLQRT